MSYFEVFLIILAVLLLLVAAFYAAIAATKITQVKSYKADQNLQSAHKALTISSVTVWLAIGVIIAIFVGLGIAAAYGGGTVALRLITNSWILRLFLILVIVIMGVGGYFCISASVDMTNSNNFNEVRDNFAYRDSTIAAGLLFGGAAAIIITFILTFAFGSTSEDTSAESLAKTALTVLP